MSPCAGWLAKLDRPAVGGFILHPHGGRFSLPSKCSLYTLAYRTCINISCISRAAIMGKLRQKENNGKNMEQGYCSVQCNSLVLVFNFRKPRMFFGCPQSLHSEIYVRKLIALLQSSRKRLKWLKSMQEYTLCYMRYIMSRYVTCYDATWVMNDIVQL